MSQLYYFFKNQLGIRRPDEEEERGLRDAVSQFEIITSSINPNSIKFATAPVCDEFVASRTGLSNSFSERYNRQLHLNHLSDAGLVEGGPKERKPKSFGFKRFLLGEHKIPTRIYEALSTETYDQIISAELTLETYLEKFKQLLFFEEAQQVLDMRSYDQTGARLTLYEGKFTLAVEGLAESRPSLMKGDKVWLEPGGEERAFEGKIIFVRSKDILFELARDLTIDKCLFDISFHTSRVSFLRCHRAIENLQGENRGLLEKILFPKEGTNSSPAKIKSGEESVKELQTIMPDLNPQQKRTVLNVLKHVARPSPYIIFGPPGTGKTTTFCEALLQVYLREKQAKILACDNSNAGADRMAVRLLRTGIVKKSEIIRLAANSWMDRCDEPELDDRYVTKDSLTMEALMECRILISTIVQTGVLWEFGLKFDHVFIDEAGHATEPEILIPMSQVAPDGSIVMAGDFKQLGPVCFSPLASQAGLSLSFLERLSRCPAYSRALRNGDMSYDEKYITKLVLSYRSDSRLMSVNNELFYDNELKFFGTTPKRFMRLLNVDSPLIFHHIKGRDRRDLGNPSWFNACEAIIVIAYVLLLYRNGLKSHQLGIITPYRKQIDKLRILFERFGLEKCKIGSTEEFQGDEREIVIISTVRSREGNIDADLRFHLGFLFDEKRFNVTTSRSKLMTIAIGDGRTLGGDPCWKKYIDSAHKIDLSKQLASPEKQAADQSG